MNSKIRELVLSVDNSEDGIVIKTYKNSAQLIDQIITERNIDGVINSKYRIINIIEYKNMRENTIS